MTRKNREEKEEKRRKGSKDQTYEKNTETEKRRPVCCSSRIWANRLSPQTSHLKRSCGRCVCVEVQGVREGVKAEAEVVACGVGSRSVRGENGET